MNTQTLKQDPSTLPNKETLDAFVKNKAGVIFFVLNHKTKPGKVLLRLRNKYFEKGRLELQQEIVDGKWSMINEHEWRRWAEEDNEYMMELSQKLVKRILLSQILLELDDSLTEDFEDDKHFVNTLNKSKKQCERIANKQFDRIYFANKTFTTNFMNKIDQVATICSKLGVDGFMHTAQTLQHYIDHPEEYRDEDVVITELDN